MRTIDSRPTISVVIPAHNAAQTIPRAIASVLAQTLLPDEIIVVDDQSSDDTRHVVTATGHSKINLISANVRKGAGGARNAGIAAATGDAIAFLDADDEWLPKKLEKQVELLKIDRRLSFVSCAATSVSDTGLDLGDTYGRHRVATGSEAWKALLACNFVATPSVLAWTRHVRALGGFNESMKIGEDQDMWIRLALAGSLGYLPEPLVRVHLMSDSLSKWALDDLLMYTLPMIEHHLEQQKHRLSKSERQRILGERLNRFGRVAYVRGSLVSGLRLILRSMLLGHRPTESLLYVLRAAPPVSWVKHQIQLANSF